MEFSWEKFFSKNIFVIIIYNLVLIFHSHAIAEQRFGYLVTGKMTLIQIARDVYGDERFWNRIAYVNNIKSPYSLSVGQRLILPFEPRQKLKTKNILAADEIPAPKDLSHDAIPQRNIVESDDEMVYIVGERAPTLTMIAIENFGHRNKVSSIARWNNLPAQAKLSMGQRLVFKQRPTLSQQESDTILSQYWKKLGNDFMGERIANHEVADPNAKTTAKFRPVSQTESDAIGPAVNNGPTKPGKSASRNSAGTAKAEADENNVSDVEPVDMSRPAGSGVAAESLSPEALKQAQQPQQSGKVSIQSQPGVALPSVSDSVLAPDPELAEISRAPAEAEKEGEPTTDVYWLGDGHIYQINKISAEQKK